VGSAEGTVDEPGGAAAGGAGRGSLDGSGRVRRRARGERARQRRGDHLDEGTVDLVRNEPGHLSFVLHGHKLAGGFALTRTGERRWILVKARDEQARPGSDITAEQPASVRSGRTYEQLL